MKGVKTYSWRRLDFVGLEIMHLRHSRHGLEAHASIIDAGDGQFSLQIEWSLDATWRSRAVTLTQQSRGGVKTLHIERVERGWVVDNKLRPELSDCLEVDVSATPFCNGLALRALAREPGELTALYVDASDLTVQPSRQRYERLGERQWRYVDLGV
ncbi:MAG TPA: putative glycolipid-binding domain-containing protein, partial [Verrucomicrobiae bacterium]|nr:putative glycolipid-binding domain-containing protein [Verrucomicrobiae bacterium]